MAHEFDEAWKRIHNALVFLSEHQAQHAVEMDEIRKMQKAQALQAAEEMGELREMHKKLALAVIETTKQVHETSKRIDDFLKGNRPNGH